MSQQLITCQLDDQMLDVDAMAIRERCAWSAATPLPNKPAHDCGVVNLHGVMLPVTGFKMRLGWGATAPSTRHVIIVVQLGNQPQGPIVDAVNDVLKVDRDTMQTAINCGNARTSDATEGIVMLRERMVVMLALSCSEAQHVDMAEAVYS